jgi:peptidoglycan hydrolase-like protein with peptidoglycan-binding domain
MTRIDQMTRQEIAEIQAQLVALGYTVTVDGVWGPRTATAYQRYLATMPVSLAVAPPADKPWWTSSALIGGLISVAAWGASFAGFQFDVESAKQAIPELVGAIFAVVAVIGTWRRKAPIDPTLIAPGVRISSPFVRSASLPSNNNGSSQPRRSEVDRAKGGFSDAP